LSPPKFKPLLIPTISEFSNGFSKKMREVALHPLFPKLHSRQWPVVIIEIACIIIPMHTVPACIYFNNSVIAVIPIPMMVLICRPTVVVKPVHIPTHQIILIRYMFHILIYPRQFRYLMYQMVYIPVYIIAVMSGVNMLKFQIQDSKISKKLKTKHSKFITQK